MAKETFNLKNANKVFPAKFTRIVLDDFLNIACEKKQFLTKEEYGYLISLAGGNIEFLIEREGRKLSFRSWI